MNKWLVGFVILLVGLLICQTHRLNVARQGNLDTIWELSQNETELKDCQTLADYRLKAINALQEASGINKYYKNP